MTCTDRPLQIYLYDIGAFISLGLTESWWDDTTPSSGVPEGTCPSVAQDSLKGMVAGEEQSAADRCPEHREKGEMGRCRQFQD